MDDFSPAEGNHQLGLMPFLKETANMTDFGFKVMLVRLGPKLDLFELNRALVFASRLLLLRGFILKFAVIHDTADRGDRYGTNLHQVKIGFLRFAEGFVGWHNAKLSSISSDHSDFGDANSTIYPKLICGSRNGARDGRNSFVENRAYLVVLGKRLTPCRGVLPGHPRRGKLSLLAHTSDKLFNRFSRSGFAIPRPHRNR